MLETRGERFRAGASTAEGGAAALAAAAIFGAGGLALPVALGLGAGLALVGFFLRDLAADLGGGSDRPASEAQKAIVVRLSPFYAFLVATVIVLFPEPVGPRGLYLLAFAEVPLLAFSGLARVRSAADANAGLLIAAANAAGGPAVPLLTAAYLTLLALTLALRHFEERSEAADAPSPDDLGGALLAAGGAAALLGLLYLAAKAVIPAPAPISFGLAPLPGGPPARPVILPWRALAALAVSVATAVGLLYAYHRFFGRLIARALAEDEGAAGVEVGAPEPLAPAPPEPEAEREVPGDARAAVVAAYRRFEAALAARDLGRAPSEAAGEHAALLGRRVPEASADLEEIARRFAGARYGADPVEPDAPAAVREAAERALATIDERFGRREEEPRSEPR